jgi:hypothetical protein
VSTTDPKISLFQRMERELAAEGFKLVKARTAFERDRDEVTDLYKLDFYTSTAGHRIQPGIIMRFAALDRIYHQVSGAKPADRKFHAAISFAIWRIQGDMAKYEFLLSGEEVVGQVAAKLIAVSRDVALPFFERHSTVEAVDRLFNKTPNAQNTVVYNADAWTRCAYATIAAKLARNPEYERLASVYDAFMKTAEGGHRHGQYQTLVKLLEKEG